MSAINNPSSVKAELALPPIITITPASLVYPLTPPLTPAEGTSSCSKRSPKTLIAPLTPLSPISSTSPTSPTPTGASIPIPPSPPFEGPLGHFDAPHSLYDPLTRHLALLHPQTPKPVLAFIATRLLSPDKPFGHKGEWEPVWQGCGDLSTAGVGVEAAKGCERRNTQGKERDERLAEMYAIARESFGRLELAGP